MKVGDRIRVIESVLDCRPDTSLVGELGSIIHEYPPYDYTPHPDLVLACLFEVRIDTGDIVLLYDDEMEIALEGE